ncbi:MAG: hypothetical protein ACSHX8_06115 [Opitutaceae bacterium]
MFICVPLFAFTEDQDDLNEWLRQYEGRWSGNFTVASEATGYTEVFTVEQQYWMVEGRLHGLSVSDRDSGLVSSKSVTYAQGGKLFSEITRGDKVESFVGVVHDDGVLWLQKDMKRANDYQIKETFVVKDHELSLITEGFDTYIYKEGLAYVIFKGKLIYKGSLKEIPK